MGVIALETKEQNLELNEKYRNSIVNLKEKEFSFVTGEHKNAHIIEEILVNLKNC